MVQIDPGHISCHCRITDLLPFELECVQALHQKLRVMLTHTDRFRHSFLAQDQLSSIA
jgi:hypothetical protein